MTSALSDKNIEELLCGSDNEVSDEDDFDTHNQDSQEPHDAEGSSSSESEGESEDDLPLSTLRWKKKKYNSKSIPEGSLPDVNPVGTPAQYFE